MVLLSILDYLWENRDVVKTGVLTLATIITALGIIVGFLKKVRIWLLKRCKSCWKLITKCWHEWIMKDSKEPNGAINLLDNANPIYDNSHLKEKTVDKNFFYPIPEKYKDVLKELSDNCFVQENTVDFQYNNTNNCLSDDFWDNTDGNIKFRTGFEAIKCEWNDEAQKELADISCQVAEKLICDLESHPRYNSVIFGVDSFHPNRKGQREKPSVQISFYRTDYFTYRVFSQFYQNHCPKNCITDDTYIISHLKSLSYPFLCSFGVNMIAVISNDCDTFLDGDDEIAIGYRSKRVIVNPGCIHFAMNETFCMCDITDKGPSIKHCAERGFSEELNWKDQEHGLKFGNFNFTDFFFCNDVGEMGIVGFTKICIKGKTIEKTKDLLRKLHKVSRDGILEVPNIDFIPIKDARDYLKKNSKSMSPSFAWALNNFMNRYELNCI